MALKDMFKKLGDKENDAMSRKDEAVDALVASDSFPIVSARDVQLDKYRKVPLAGLAALGGAFVQLPQSARTIATTVSRAVDLPQKLYQGVWPKGVKGQVKDYGQGISGNIVNKKGDIVGRMRFREVSQVPVKETTTTVVPFDPMTMTIAAALYTIDRKITDLQKKAEDILQFLKRDKEARQRGNLNMLADILEEYKQEFNDGDLCRLRANAVQDIKKEAYQDIQFYENSVEKHLQEQEKLHGNQKAQTLVEKVTEEFSEYQLACYLFGFASFMEVMLLKKLDASYLESVVNSLNRYSARYEDLYKMSREQLTAYQENSIEAKLLGGFGNAVRAVGERIASVQALNKGHLDEKLVDAGNAIGQFNQKTINKRVECFGALEESRMHSFAENLQLLDTMVNQENGLLMDGENLYIMERI